jgi:2-keto-3-deoxy-L-rhamnonate aldolase RhmA
VIDILGKLDFDFVFIDGEHGPFGLDQLKDLWRTAERHNARPVFFEVLCVRASSRRASCPQ